MIHSEAARSRIVPRVLRSNASHQRRLRSSPDHRQIDQIRRTKKPLKLHFQNSMYEKLCDIEPCKTHLSGLRVTPIFYFLPLRAFPAYMDLTISTESASHIQDLFFLKRFWCRNRKTIGTSRTARNVWTTIFIFISFLEIRYGRHFILRSKHPN